MDDHTDRQWIKQNLDIGKELLYLTKQECSRVGLTVEQIMLLTKEALVAHGKKETEMPAKIGVHPFDDVFYHAMPAYVPSKQAVGMKWIECYPNNPKEYHLPQTTGLFILNDVFTGCPMAIMDSTLLTALRTPAVTMLAIQALHPYAKRFGMYGCGVQGVEHVRFAAKTLKNLQQIFIYDIDEGAMDRLIRTIGPTIDIPIIKSSHPKEPIEACDVLSSATVIVKETKSFIGHECVRKGQTILPCDLNTFWDPLIAKRANQYIVDSKEEHELFENMGYFPDGLPDVTCEIGEILAGLEKGRTSKEELIVCSNIGMAVCDVVVAKELFHKALQQKIGQKIPL